MWDVPSRSAAGLSVLGDFLIIGATTLGRRRRQFTTGILRALSAADMITSIAMVFNGPVLRSNGGFWCEAVAVCYWYGAWASWLWNAGYAYTLWHCLLGGLRKRDGLTESLQHTSSLPMAGLHIVPLSTPAERTLHAMCWGIPLALVVLVKFLPDASFGPAVDMDDCTLTATTPIRNGMLAPLWAVVFYSSAVLCALQWRLCRSMDKTVARLEADAAVVARRRITLWPQFVAYLALFILSQGPGAIESALPGTSDLPEQVDVIINVLSNLNGFLNSVVFSCTNSEIYRELYWLGCFTRDADNEPASRGTHESALDTDLQVSSQEDLPSLVMSPSRPVAVVGHGVNSRSTESHGSDSHLGSTFTPSTLMEGRSVGAVSLDRACCSEVDRLGSYDSNAASVVGSVGVDSGRTPSNMAWAGSGLPSVAANLVTNLRVGTILNPNRGERAMVHAGVERAPTIVATGIGRVPGRGFF